MMHKLINLLPPARYAALRRDYFFRLAVLACVLLTSLVIANIALLIPSYLFIKNQIHARESELVALSEALKSTEERELSARLTQLEQDTEHLAELAQVPTASAAIRAVLELARPGIVLTGFAFTPPTADVPARLAVSGRADERESLRRYVALLAEQAYVDRADLPISAYAAERDIAFTITLSGTLLP